MAGAACMAHAQLCMRNQGMVCCRKVLLLPRALHINATSVSGRTGFANFSAWNHEELRMLPNREKDKCRILSEGWYRTQWGGYSPGGK
eukprot:1148351-Pelagomonas_calceolata.AAC.2